MNKTTDLTTIESIVSSLIETDSAYIAINRKDYETTKSLFGEPSVAIETGVCSCVESLLDSLKLEFSGEDFQQVRAVMAFISASREGLTMFQFQQVNDTITDALPSDVRFMRGLSFDMKGGNLSVTLVLWE